ncbi:hypothetical protein D7Z94_20145 [Ulvibacterium marinum]|uniref:Uncharacterized protein n=1 Tax=Ulvibacterium marinum TaxID=2419782 RepID=A0A3B0C3W8_9FLAO|nr:hypothetical protein D7Z94_20145 [Ulvibacterium marinum]
MNPTIPARTVSQNNVCGPVKETDNMFIASGQVFITYDHTDAGEPQKGRITHSLLAVGRFKGLDQGCS